MDTKKKGWMYKKRGSFIVRFAEEDAELKWRMNSPAGNNIPQRTQGKEITTLISLRLAGMSHYGTNFRIIHEYIYIFYMKGKKR